MADQWTTVLSAFRRQLPCSVGEMAEATDPLWRSIRTAPLDNRESRDGRERGNNVGRMRMTALVAETEMEARLLVCFKYKILFSLSRFNDQSSKWLRIKLWYDLNPEESTRNLLDICDE
ncbi:hypothetical protein TNIN_321411 [Trichonephila inaurata madagascariensis]|uniref:Uncharacterized protein n=1 Tax=Trichonephila inaurata madagascariensis TaxID=2747483 RepID=A0A8X6XUZ6_9ARAC|nr:hypothetical protein TNIN_321411 [Trichonephila inaurata madagascariensis]